MRRVCICVLLMVWMATNVHAVTLRYAIVVGNNNGLDEDGKEPFPRLKHAEREALLLREKLVLLSNFDPSPTRTVLLLGATREQVRQSVAGIVKQKERDVDSLGGVDTLFAFFFTGHGLSGTGRDIPLHRSRFQYRLLRCLLQRQPGSGCAAEKGR